VTEPKSAKKSHDSALPALARQRRKLVRWAIVAGLIGLLAVAAFNPSLAVLTASALAVLGLLACGISAVMRWFDQ
jgi:hypothetical protein